MKRYAKDFDPDTRVVENCKYMAALGRIQELESMPIMNARILAAAVEIMEYMYDLLNAHDFCPPDYREALDIFISQKEVITKGNGVQ